MSRLQVQAPLRSTDGRLRLPSAFLPTSRAVFADREQNAFTNVADATAATLRSAAGVAVALNRDNTDNLRSQYEADQADIIRFSGLMSRTDPTSPEARKYAGQIEDMNTRLSEKYQGTEFEADVARALESARNQAFGINQQAARQAEQDAEDAARGRFEKVFFEHVRDSSSNEALMEEYLQFDPAQLDELVEQDFLSAMPDEMRAAVFDSPELTSRFYRYRNDFVNTIDRRRADIREDEDNRLAAEALVGNRTRFVTDEQFSVVDLLSKVPSENHDKELQELSGFLKTTLSIPPATEEGLRVSVIAAKKAETLLESYTAQGRADLAEDLSDGLRAYYNNRSADIIRDYEPDYTGQVTDEFIAGYEQHALARVAAVLGVDTSRYSSVEEAATAMEDTTGGPLLDSLVSHRRMLDRFKQESADQSEQIKLQEAGAVPPGLLSERDMYHRKALDQPELTADVVRDRLLQIVQSEQAALEVDTINEHIESVGSVLTSLAAGAPLSPDQQVDLAIAGSYTDGRRASIGDGVPLDTAAEEMSSLVSEGNNVGIRMALSYMQGLGTKQGQFLLKFRDGAKAHALNRLARTNTDGFTAEDLEAQYQEFFGNYTQIQEQIKTLNQGRDRDDQIATDLTANEKFRKGIRNRVSQEFLNIDPSAQAPLRFLVLPKQVEDLETAGETVMDRASQFNLSFYVEDGTLKAIQTRHGGRMVTPAALGVSPPDLDEAVREPVMFSQIVGNKIYNRLGSEQTGNFDEAISDYLVARAPGRFKSKDTIKAALEDGTIRPQFRYSDAGISLWIERTPSVVNDEGRPIELEPFSMQVLQPFSWQGGVSRYWQSASPDVAEQDRQITAAALSSPSFLAGF